MANNLSRGVRQQPSASVPKLVHPRRSSAGRRHRRIMWVLFLGTLCWGIPAASVPTAVAQSEPLAADTAAPSGTTWIVVRHADRDGEADRLTAAGLARAEALADFAGPLRVAAMYSTNYQRTQDTLRPLAQRLALPIEVYQHPTAEWLAEVRRSHRGKVVVIVGHSNTVGEIVHQLSGQPSFTLPHEEYDSLFVIAEQTQPATVLRWKFGAATDPSNAAPPAQMGPVRGETPPSPAQSDKPKR